MPQPAPDFHGILNVLTEHEVEFIVVGGVCGILHGSPLITRDIDIVHRRTAENLERLAAALTALGAHYREHPKRIEPTAKDLDSSGHHLLLTDRGQLDVLGSLAEGQGYDALLARTSEIMLELTLTVRVLDLDALIEAKEKAGRPKDHNALFVLRELLQEKRKREAEEPPPG